MNESSEVNVSENSFESINKSNKKILIFVALFVLLVVVILIVVSNTPAKRLQRQLDLGTRYLEELNYEKAIAAFEAAIEIDSKNLKAYEGLVGAYAGEGDVDGIIGVYERACDNLEPENLDLIRQVSVDGVNGIVSDLVADGDYEKALSAARSLSQIDESASNAAVVNIVESNPAALLDALESSDASSEIADAKGLILIGNGRYEDAIDYFEDRIVSNSETTYSYLGLASAYLGNDDVLGALEILEKGIGTGADETVIRSEEDYIRQNSIIVSCNGTMDFWPYGDDSDDREHGETVETYDEYGNQIASDESRNTDYSRHSELDGNGHYLYERHTTGDSYFEMYWTYNEQGDPVSERVVSYSARDNSTSFTDYSISYEYDSEGKIISETRDGNSAYQRIYEYDENGYISRVSHTTNGVTSYETYIYDNQGRLIEWTDYRSNVSRYEYDDRGNRIKEYYETMTRTTDFDLMNNWIREESLSHDDIFNSLGVWTRNYEYHFIGDVMGAFAQ